ncbi:nitroreductase family protein [Kitasatospora sp. NPDC056327]|uniref:nitroreductase family protein n=1 Tax=Kitasatospora sp. NPDC056327 TaxID=3345785 RepID=UPI0035DF7A86
MHTREPVHLTDTPAGVADDTELARIWAELTTISARPVLAEDTAPGPGLARALGVVDDGILSRGPGGIRSVPSAGAIFPYDVLVLDRSAPGPAVLYRLDLDRRLCVRTAGGPPLDEVLAGTTDDDRSVLVLLAVRPWLSIRKYGPRGYLYAQIDAGHAATNLLGTALDHGAARLRLAVPRRRLAEALADHLPYRGIHSVLELEVPERDAAVPAPAGWGYLHQEHPAPMESTGRLEAVCWAGIPGLLAAGRDRAPVVARTVVDAVPPLLAPEGIRPGEWTGLSRVRRSSKRFGRQALDPAVLLDAVGALATELPCDLTGSGFGVTVLTPPGRFPDRGPGHGDALRFVGTAFVTGTEDIARACMGQSHLAGADSFVLLHADRAGTLGTGPAPLREAIFRSAAAAHLLYLGAARNAIGVTGVGGFDAARWLAAAGLDDTRELLYIVALGSDRDDDRKLDRAEIAYAQGEG